MLSHLKTPLSNADVRELLRAKSQYSFFASSVPKAAGLKLSGEDKRPWSYDLYLDDRVRWKTCALWRRWL